VKPERITDHRVVFYVCVCGSMYLLFQFLRLLANFQENYHEYYVNH